MTQSRAVQQIPLNPPASRPRVGLCVSLKLSSVLECVYLCVLWALSECGSVCLEFFVLLIFFLHSFSSNYLGLF